MFGFKSEYISLNSVFNKDMGCMLYVLLCNDLPLLELKYDVSTTKVVAIQTGHAYVS